MMILKINERCMGVEIISVVTFYDPLLLMEILECKKEGILTTIIPKFLQLLQKIPPF